MAQDDEEGQQPSVRRFRRWWLTRRLSLATVLGPSLSKRCSVLCLALLPVLVVWRWLLSTRAASLGRVGVPAEVAKLIVWLEDSGAEFHECAQIQLCGSGGGRCVAARCAIKSGQRLASVPNSAQVRAEGSVCPSLSTWLRKPTHEGGVAEMHLNGESMLLMLKLLEEVSLGSGGHWALYLPTIPEGFPAIMRKEAVQRQCFAGTNAAVHIARRFERQAALLTLLHRCRDYSSSADGSAATREREEHQLLWAVHVIGSRAYETPAGPILVPFCDMFNDSPHNNAEWRLNSESDAFEIVSKTHISSGDEITISYGSKSNEQLLTHYGFLHQFNINDVLHIDPLGMDTGALASPGSRLALSFDTTDAARSFITNLASVRLHLTLGHPELKDEKQSLALERKALELVGRSCAEEAKVLSSLDQQQGNGTATQQEQLKACFGYRSQVAMLAQACASAVDNVTTMLQSLPQPGPKAVPEFHVESTGWAKQLPELPRMVQHDMMAAWEADAAKKRRLPHEALQALQQRHV